MEDASQQESGHDVNRRLILHLQLGLDNLREVVVELQQRNTTVVAPTEIEKNDEPEAIAEIKKLYEAKIAQLLSRSVDNFLVADCNSAWLEIRKLLETSTIFAEYSTRLDGVAGVDEALKGTMVDSLRKFGRTTVENKVREEASKVSILIKRRFTSLFSLHVWNQKEELQKILKSAKVSVSKSIVFEASV